MLQLGTDGDTHIDLGDPPMVDGPSPSPRTRRPDEPERLSRPDYLDALGRASIAAGALILLFCAYQLWGSGLLEWQAQRALDAEFASQLDQRRPERGATDRPVDDATGADGIPIDVTPTDGDRATPAPGAGAGPDPETDPDPGPPQTTEVQTTGLQATGLQAAEGDPIGRIEIPAIDVTKTFVLGVERTSLRQGPGLYPTTALPGQAGNTAIAGHRTTHGAPFGQIDQLQPGDEITVDTVDGVFTYRVIGHAQNDGAEVGHQIVDPSEVAVIGDLGDNRLTLTACHPRFSARQRIIVSAALVGPPTVAPASRSASIEPIAAPAPPSDDSAMAEVAPEGEFDGAQAPTPESATAESNLVTAETAAPGATIGADEATLDSALGWQRHEAEPTLLWATVFVLIGFCGWVLGRLWRRRLSYALITPVAAVPLFFCFVHLDRLLPAF